MCIHEFKERKKRYQISLETDLFCTFGNSSVMIGIMEIKDLIYDLLSKHLFQRTLQHDG